MRQKGLRREGTQGADEKGKSRMEDKQEKRRGKGIKGEKREETR